MMLCRALLKRRIPRIKVLSKDFVRYNSRDVLRPSLGISTGRHFTTTEFDSRNNIQEGSFESPMTESSQSKYYQDFAETMANDIQVGAMSLEMWADTKKLLLGFCKKNEFETSRMLLRRLVKEAVASEHALFLNAFHTNSVLEVCSKLGKEEDAELLINEMLENHKKWPDHCEQPNLYSYNLLIHTYGRSNNPSSQRVIEIIDFLEKSPDIHPELRTYNEAMLSVLRENRYGSAKLAEDILLRLSQRHKDGLLKDGPNIASFNIVIDAWTKESPLRSLEIYRLMRKLSEDGHSHLKPSEYSLSIVIRAFAKEGNIDMVKELYKEVQNETGNLTHCHNGVLAAWANSGHPQAGQEAHKFMNTAVLPDGAVWKVNETSHRLIIKAYVKSAHPVDIDAAYNYLIQLVQDAKENKVDESCLSLSMFHMVLRAFRDARSNIDYSEKALRLLDDIRFFSGSWAGHPGTYSFCLNILLHNLSEASASKAVELLQEANENGCQPNVSSMNKLIDGLLQEDPISFLKMSTAIKLLKLMGDNANIGTYNIICQGLQRMESEKAMQQALDLVRNLEQRYKEGLSNIQPDILTYTSILKGFAALGGNKNAVKVVHVFNHVINLHCDPKRSLKVTVSAYNTVLVFLSRERTVYAAREANRIIQQLIDQKYGVYPNPGCLSSPILAAARILDSQWTCVAHNRLVEFAGLYLNEKNKFFPHPSAFISVMYAWGKSNNVKAPEKVREVFNLLEKVLKTAGSAEIPNEIYTVYFSVLSQKEPEVAARQAEATIDRIGCGDTVLWNTVLAAWANSDSETKLKESLRILDKMPNADLISYNIILKAVSLSPKSNSKEALKIGHDILKRVKSSGTMLPDRYTYGSLIVSYRRLLEKSDPMRQQYIEMLVKECITQGLFSSLLGSQIRNEFSPDELKEKWNLELTKDEQQFTNIPSEWTRNLARKRTQKEILV